MHEPSFELFLDVLLKRGKVNRVPMWELFVDAEVVSAILGRPFVRPRDGGNLEDYVDGLIEFQLTMGYDYLPVFLEPKLPRNNILTGDDTAALAKVKRTWVDEHTGTIVNREQFETYPWPSPEDVDYSLLEAAGSKLPDGMKIMVWTSGVLEFVQWLMGYENMALAVYDDPDIIDDLFGKIGDILSDIFRQASTHADVGLLAMGDDMGFNSGTLFSPDFLRKYVFPRQKRCVDHGHNRGIPFILHSCGNLETIMDDIIDFVGVDGKHSFEDKVIPIEDAIRKYGDRVTLVGGVDVDFMCRKPLDDIRARVRALLENSSPEGGYIMGSGNSIANYIPLESYRALVDETARFRFAS